MPWPEMFGRPLSTGVRHLVKESPLSETAVEAVAEFRQVAGQVFLTPSMMDAPDIALKVGIQSMHPEEQLHDLGA